MADDPVQTFHHRQQHLQLVGRLAGIKEGKIIVCPGTKLTCGTITSWGFRGQIPDSWQKYSVQFSVKYEIEALNESAKY